MTAIVIRFIEDLDASFHIQTKTVGVTQQAHNKLQVEDASRIHNCRVRKLNDTLNKKTQL